MSDYISRADRYKAKGGTVRAYKLVSADRPITSGYIADDKEVPPYTTTSAVSAERVGEWELYEDIDGEYGICSVCRNDADFSHYGKPYHYCPNCGARMKGGTNG